VSHTSALGQSQLSVIDGAANAVVATVPAGAIGGLATNPPPIA
jgi:hypothetical protein